MFHKATGGRQEPFWYGSLSSQKLFLNDLKLAKTEPPTAQIVEPVEPPAVEIETKLGLAEQGAVWNSIKDTDDPDLVATFLEIYPQSPFAPFARKLLDKLQNEATRVTALQAKLSDEPPAANTDLAEKAQDLFADPTQLATAPERSSLPPAQPQSADEPIELAAVTPETPKAPSNTAADKLAVPAADILPNFPDDKPLTRTEIREIQERLSALGHKPGPADGIMGGRTRTAIIQFETNSGTPNSTGDATLAVLMNLRVAVSDTDMETYRAALREEQRAARARQAARQAELARQRAAQKPPAAQPAPQAQPAMTAEEIEAAERAARREERRRKRRAKIDGEGSGGGSSGGGSEGGGCGTFSC